MPNTPPLLMAKGTIRPCRFVKLDASNPHGALECDANDIPIGISYDGTNKPPIEGLVTTAYAAEAGQSLPLYGDGDICLLEAGDNVVTGNRLKSDNDGKGVPIATTGTTIQHFGAVALENGASGTLVRVQVKIGSERPALT